MAAAQLAEPEPAESEEDAGFSLEDDFCLNQCTKGPSCDWRAFAVAVGKANNLAVTNPEIEAAVTVVMSEMADGDQAVQANVLGINTLQAMADKFAEEVRHPCARREMSDPQIVIRAEVARQLEPIHATMGELLALAKKNGGAPDSASKKREVVEEPGDDDDDGASPVPEHLASLHAEACALFKEHESYKVVVRALYKQYVDKFTLKEYARAIRPDKPHFVNKVGEYTRELRAESRA